MRSLIRIPATASAPKTGLCPALSAAEPTVSAWKLFYNAGLKEHKSSHDSRISGYGIDALVFQQLGCSGRWELVGSAGLANYKLKGDNGLGTDRGYAERLGAGVQYAMSENATVRVMYHHAWVHSSQLDALDEFTVGIRYAF